MEPKPARRRQSIVRSGALVLEIRHLENEFCHLRQKRLCLRGIHGMMAPYQRALVARRFWIERLLPAAARENKEESI